MDYFKKVQEQTPTRFWINNPSLSETDKAISAGSRNATTNPAYCSKLLKSEPEYIREIIDSIVRNTEDDDIAADLIYQAATKKIMEKFSAIFRDTNGEEGFVTIQLDPREDEDPDAIVKAALRHGRTGSNYMAKIPVTLAGAKAIESVLKLGIPVCATEIFSVSQALFICDLHERVCKETGRHVPMYVTHITGIFDEYLQRFSKIKGIDIKPEILSQAGSAAGRKQYHLLKDRGYRVKMLGGGARGIHHFSDFVGGDLHITINWSTAQELIDQNEPVFNKIDIETPESVISELRSKLDVFRKAYDEDGLKPEEFAKFGPVQLFRNNFIEGYYILLAEISARRAQLLV